MALIPGARIGPFLVKSSLGEGGMGIVFRALDTKLQRDVALKLLPDHFADDPERLARFQREAQVLASLNHPNIAQIYGLEESDNTRCIVMELVEGESPKGPLPLDETLRIALQIADALEAAHETGITHRDLKPSNIKIKPDGKVKVLDFGLAKVASTSPSDPENSPTLSMAATQAGMILGTAGYMSPEQARGKPVDKRADIWAFGVLVNEMLTGERLFEGETISDTLAQVLMKEPDLARVPARVRKLLARCLQKEPKQRLRDIGEARFCLEEPAPPQLGTDSRIGRIPWMFAVLATVAALTLGVVAYRHYTEEAQMIKLFLPPPDKGAFAASSSIPAISPDGRRVAFVATLDGKTSLWVQELDTVAARPLPGTEGARSPFWSPDSRTIAFSDGGALKKIDVAGGPATTLCRCSAGLGGTWSQNDIIVFSNGGDDGLFRVSASGGTATPLTELDRAEGETNHRFPWFLPDGKHFLYTARNVRRDKTTISIGDVDSKKGSPILTANSNAVYSRAGYLLFLSDRTLKAQPFDPRIAKTTGEAIPIAERVDVGRGTFAEGHFSVSQNGILAYISGARARDTLLTWFDRTGKPMGTVGSSEVTLRAAISPDGRTVAWDRRDAQTGSADIWLHDLAHGNDLRFTLSSGIGPVWSPDGSHIAFWAFDRDGTPGVYQKAGTGTNPSELLYKLTNLVRLTDWSHDYIFEERTEDSETKADIWVLPLSGDKKPFPYLNGPYNESFARLSPNGKWLAYQSEETRRPEIFVETFPKRGGKWTISTESGTLPVWSRDGKDLYYIRLDQKLMAVEIGSGPNFEWRNPKPLFDVRMDAGVQYDVSKDGKFLIPAQTPFNSWGSNERP